MQARVTVPIALTLTELYLLINMLTERIIQAQDDGIEVEHSSSIFRNRLLDKLIDAYKESNRP